MTLAIVEGSAPDTVLASVEVAVEDPPPPPPPPPPPEPVRRVAIQEALGTQAMPSWVGLRDEQRSGSGGHLGVLVASARLGEPTPRVRLVAGATAGLFDDYLRISAIAPLDVIGQSSRDADRGARDLFVSLGSRVLAASPAGGLGLAVELGVWAPTAGALGLDRGRLSIAGDLSLRFAERVVLRTRQAGLFDLAANGSLLWASAYGLDVVIAGPFSIGVEGTMTMGTEAATSWYSGGVGLGLGLDLSPVVISPAGRLGFGDDLWPQATVVASARALFE
jgi:hypothetical protein